MKKLPIVFCAFLTLAPLNVLAEQAKTVATEQTIKDLKAHRDQRNKVEAEELLSRLKASEGRALIEIADTVTGAGLVEPELTAWLKIKTEDLLAKNIAEPKNKDIARELNAVMRAYGSMGYSIAARGVIQKALDTSKSRGVRNRAIRLIPKLYWFTERNALMSSMEYYAPEQAIETHRFMALLGSESPDFRRFGAEEINRQGGTAPEAYALMAKILEKDKYVKEGINLDAMAWYARVLSSYAKDDYQALLVAIKNDKATSKKLKKYAKP